MFSALLDYVLCRSRAKTMKEKLDEAEAVVTATSGDQKPLYPQGQGGGGAALPRTLSIRIPRTASCERCSDIVVVHPAEPVTPEWKCAPCASGGRGLPHAPRPGGACC